jgi:hypothetical protein
MQFFHTNLYYAYFPSLSRAGAKSPFSGMFCRDRTPAVSTKHIDITGVLCYNRLDKSGVNKVCDYVSTFLCMVLFVAFASAQLLCAKSAAHKVIRYIPMLTSAVGCLFAVGLHIYAIITYGMGVVSESVLAENQYFASFILIPAGICLIGAAAGFLIGKKVP